MRYLITGGAGFIGSHLSETLLEKGAEVFILDDLSTGSVENIRHLKSNNRFHHFFDSIQNKHLLGRARRRVRRRDPSGRGSGRAPDRRKPGADSRNEHSRDAVRAGRRLEKEEARLYRVHF